MNPQDLSMLKYGVGIGISIFVIRELFRLIYFLLKSRKTAGENELRETSRQLIRNSSETIQEMREPFWAMKNKCDGMHEVITAKTEGVPLVYNKGLERSMDALNNSIGQLGIAIANLGENCKKKADVGI